MLGGDFEIHLTLPADPEALTAAGLVVLDSNPAAGAGWTAA
jgi:hypothetical protein